MSRSRLAMLAVLFMVPAGPVVASAQSPTAPDTVSLVLGVADPRDRPSQSAVDSFVATVHELSGGTIAIDPIFEAGDETAEGGEVGVAGMIQRGEVDLALVASRAWDLAGADSLRSLQAPFLITTDALAASVASGDIAARALAGLERVGVAGLAIWPEDLRHPFSFIPGEPLLDPADFEGEVILFQPSGVTEALIEVLGGTHFADDMDRGEAVALGLLHGAESGLRQGASLPGSPTATGNVTFYPKFQVLAANASALASLTPEHQAIVRAAAAETQRRAMQEHPSEADAAAEWCAAGGSIVLASDEQLRAFEDSAKPIVDAIGQDPVAAELIADIRALKETTEPSPGAAACEPMPSASPHPAAQVLASDARWDPTTIPGLSFPAGMDVSLDGELYLVNAGTDEIIVLDREGVVLRRWGESGRADGQLDFDRGDIEPIGGVAVGSDGSVYVTEPGIDRVQQFDREGTFIRRWGGPGRGPGQFLYPWDVAVGPDGSVYIVDAVRDDIQRFTSDGTHLATIGAHGSEDGQLRETASITVGADGVLYNADWGNDRVQAWDADGRFLWSLGTRDVDGVAFQRPNDVAIDAAGRMYVTDQRRIQVFDRARTLIGSWTIPEDAPGGEMYAIAVGPDGDLFGDVLYNQALYRLHALDGPSANVPARGSHESAASALGEAR